MSNPFSSALSYLGYGGGKGISEAAARFVGQQVDLGGDSKLKVKKVIAEGGYGYVFVAQDTQTGVDYALKRQVVPKENVKVVKREIAFLKQLRGHPHIINYEASAGIPPSHTTHGSAEFLIQTELCSGGRMEEVLRSTHLTPGQVLRVFYATCSAVAHMHAQQPPIIHRDLKAENLLLSSDGMIKLCDFGSATNQQLHPDGTWTSVQRGLAEDEIQRNTTPMYRSPEMIDLYSNKPVCEKSDVWALGCLLYLLCFRTHPFEDSGKLRIINANYKIPESDGVFVMFHELTKACLVVEPARRPSVDGILAQLYGISDQLGENMEQPSLDLLGIARQTSERSQGHAEGDEGGEGDGNDGGGGVSAALQSTSQQAQKLFGYMREGAGSFLKNIKESSSKALNAMSAAAPRRSGLDITYVTSRILAMSYPHEDSFHSHHIAEVKNFLDERHPSAYLIFNLSDSNYDPAKLGNQVYDFPWPQRGVPELEKMVDLCRGMDSWLRAEPSHVIVIHCHDGLSITPIAVVSYLLFLGVITSPMAGLNYVALKRRPEAPTVVVTPSQLRYLDGMVRLVGRPPYKPHACKLTITMLRLTTVPLFNAIRTGCKPFVEVYQDGERVYTSASQDSMESIRSFHSDDQCVEIPLGITVQGNVTVNVYHIRAIPVARKAGVGMTAVKMFFFYFHTGFLDIQEHSFTFDRKDLDGSSIKKKEKFPSPFHAIVEGEWEMSMMGVFREASWQNLPYPKSSPLTCFSSVTEQEEVMKLIDPRKYAVLSRRLPDVPTTPTTPPSQTVVPQAAQHLPNLVEIEEQTSAGSGNLLGGASTVAANEAAAQAGRDFFSQLDWEENQRTPDYSGYVQFEDQDPEARKSHTGTRNGANSSSGSSSDSSSSGGSSDDEFNEFQGIVFGAQSENMYAQPAKLKAKQSGDQSRSHPPQGNPQSEAEMEKLIEFSFEEPVENIEAGPNTKGSSGPAPKKDPFQKTNSTSGATDSFAGVVFDPWGTFSPPDESEELMAESNGMNVEDILGLGGHAADKPPHSGRKNVPSSQPGGVGAPPPKQQTASSGLDPFDPFGSIQTSSSSTSYDPFGTVSTAPTSSTSQPNGTGATSNISSSNNSSKKPFGANSTPDPFGMMGDTPLLIPAQSSNTFLSSSSTTTSSQNLGGSMGAGPHRQSDPFIQPSAGSILTPSASTGFVPPRKMSSPEPHGFAKMYHQPPPTFGSKLTPSHHPKASSSHPNLLFADQRQQNAGMGFGGMAGWNQSMGMGFGAGKGGSMSQNTSPRRTPSPVSMSRSSENVSLKPDGMFDPFKQFDIKSMGQHQAPPAGPGQGSAMRNGMGTSSAPRTTQTSGLPPTGNSYRPYYMQNQSNPSASGSRASSAGTSRSNGASVPGSQMQGVGPKSKSSVFQNRPQSPNYNPSYSTAGNKTGMPTKPKQDAFGDLLGSGFNPKKNSEPKSLKDMKSKQDISNSLDPERARVAAWADKKERNIRAILGSLHEILWEGESRWKEVGMHQLVQPEQVSKFYRKACLSVHPDKAQGTDHETLARAIFDELNDAYAKFEASGARPLY